MLSFFLFLYLSLSLSLALSLSLTLSHSLSLSLTLSHSLSLSLTLSHSLVLSSASNKHSKVEVKQTLGCSEVAPTWGHLCHLLTCWSHANVSSVAEGGALEAECDWAA